MSERKWMDIAFSAGKYTDAEGKERTRYQPGGKVCIESDGRMWGILEFLGQSMMFGIFEQRDKDAAPDRGKGGSRRDSGVRESSKPARPPIDDDEIPF
jgi:hypothetical protein